MAEPSREHEPEQQRERGKQDHGAGEHGDDDEHERVVRRGRLAHGQAAQQDRVLRERPAGDDRSDGDRGGVARRLKARAPDELERGEARERGHDHGADGVAVQQPLVQRVCVGVQHGEARERQRSREQPGGERARPEARLQVRVVRAHCVSGEEHGGEVGGGCDGEDADEDRRGVQPAGEQVSGGVADGDAARGDPADDRAERERREDRGEREHGVDRSPLARA